MVSEVASSLVAGSSITTKTIMGKSADESDITPFTNYSSSNAGYVLYTLFLGINTLFYRNVIGPKLEA